MISFIKISYFLRFVGTGMLLIVLANPSQAQIKIGTNGNKIEAASILELESTNQGLLLPRLSDTVAINVLKPPAGMVIYLTKAPGEGLYTRRSNGWEFLTGFPGGNANFNSLTVAGLTTSGSFKGPLNGNATSATTALTATNAINSAITNDPTIATVTYPTFVTATPGNMPLTTSSTKLSFVPATGTLTVPQFKGDLTGNVTGTATLAIDAENSANSSITNDMSSGTVHYPTFVAGTTGNQLHKTGGTNLTYIPLTGELRAKVFRGMLIGNASSAGSVSGNVPALNGGTGQTAYTPGDILYANSTTSLSRLPVGSPGTVLGVSSGNLPVWQNAGTGTVSNVTGVSSRIAVTNGTTTPVIDISPNYPGQPSISSLGTIMTGVWNATPVAVSFGGTGVTSLAAGSLIGNGTGAIGSITGTAGQVLTSNGAGVTPSFQTSSAGDMFLNTSQTVTGAKTFGAAGNVGKLILAGNTSGLTTLNGPATGTGGTVVLPLSGTLATLTGTETLTNKTLTSATLVTPDIGNATGSGLNVGAGNITAGSFTGNLSGNATTATTSTNFTGSLAGDVSGNQGTTVVSAVGGQTAANVALGTAAANSAASANTFNTLVKRDNSGNFSAGTITANLTGNVTGNASTATNFTGPLVGDVSGTQGATVVSTIAGQTATNVALGTAAANSAASANTVNTLVKRDNSGNFSAGTITANLTGNVTGNASTATTSTNFTGSLVGDVSGTQGATAIGAGKVINTMLAGSIGIDKLASGVGNNMIYTTDGSGVPVLVSKSTFVSNSLPTGNIFIGGATNLATPVELSGDLTLTPISSTQIEVKVNTNANLTGAVTSVGNATSLGSFTSSDLVTALTNETGSGFAVFSTSPTLVTPVLGVASATSLSLGTALSIANGGTGATTFINAQTNLGFANSLLASAFTTTSNTLVDAGLGFTLGANETWQFDISLRTGSNNNSGIEVGITFPSGTIMATLIGNTSNTNVLESSIITASGTPGIDYITQNSQNGVLRIQGVVNNGVTPGTLQLQVLKTTAGTATIGASSYLTAQRFN